MGRRKQLSLKASKKAAKNTPGANFRAERVQRPPKTKEAWVNWERGRGKTLVIEGAPD